MVSFHKYVVCFVYTFCMLYALVLQNLILKSEHLFVTDRYCMYASQNYILVQWMIHNNKKCVEKIGTYTLCIICSCVLFIFILYCTNNSSQFFYCIFFFSLLLACGNDGVFFVYILLQMGWA